MRLKIYSFNCIIIAVLLSLLQLKLTACYKNEIEITPAPVEEETTKKSGFFGGIKNFFRGSPSSTTVEPPVLDVTTPRNVPHAAPNTPYTPVPNGAQKPPPLTIPHAPLMPLGPRPETPPSSPLAGNQQAPPQWPIAGAASTTTIRTPQQYPQASQSNTNYFGGNNGAAHFGGGAGAGVGGGSGGSTAYAPQRPGFGPYQPPKAQPSGLDLSYGTRGTPNPSADRRPGTGLSPITSSTTTTTTTTARSIPTQFDMRGSFDTSTTTRTPQKPTDDFPSLPTSRASSPTPASPLRPSSPSAWNTPLNFPSTPANTLSTTSTVRPSSPSMPSSPLRPGFSAPSSTITPQSPQTPPAGGNRVSFVPHSPGTIGGKPTTVRPGFESTGNSLATDDELLALSENLYQKEVNSQMNLIRVNLQGKTRSIDSADEAPQPLLELDPKALESSTIAKMSSLFNNYESAVDTNEHVTPLERKEENDFLDAVMATSVMRQAMQFLQNKGVVTADPKTHRDLVKELWFTQYSRGGGKIGSSGFEHVFVNEVKNGTLIGLHNWVYFHEEEKAGRLDYKGYMAQSDLGSKGKVVKLRFTHNGLNKPVNTLFVGTSPELELALYTVCFQIRPDRTCPVSLGNTKIGIVTYTFRYRGKNLIGSAYPEL